MNDPSRHLTDEEIVRLIDEGDTGEARAATHVELCETCRARVVDTEALFAALRTAPPPADAELAAQRDRILAAVRSRPRAAARRLSRRSVWLPAAAAAAIAALILWAPRGTRSPETAPTADATAPDPVTLPVIVEATRAAEEVVRAADDPETVERLVESSPVDLTRPDLGVSTSGGWNEALEIEEVFAGLPPADREAILTELASARFDPVEILTP